ncbi:hypothetical protein N9383_00155 [Granulosicoccus sp.]|nr:hypothetical protein [Granulosicoccus sp.]
MTCFRHTPGFSVNFVNKRNADCIGDGDTQFEKNLLGKQGVSENWQLRE